MKGCAKKLIDALADMCMEILYLLGIEKRLATRIQVPTFDIASNPQIQLSEIRQRRFNIVSRTNIQARADIQREEDIRIFEAMSMAIAPENYTEIMNFVQPHFTIIGFKPSKEKAFEYPKEEDNIFTIYGVK